MNITLVQLRALVAVSDAQGFTVAADEHGTTQAALSYAIASLEKTVGGRVFDRRPRPVLTELGASLLPHARAAIAAADRTRLAAEVHLGRSVGTFKLAASTTACASIVPALRSHWATTFPGIEIEVMQGEDDEMPVWLQDGIVDAAILINPDSVDGRAKLVAHDLFEAVLRRDHPYAALTSIPVADLLDDPVLVSDTGCRSAVLAICWGARPDFAPAREVRELTTVMTMVASGLGVSIIPGLGRALIREDLALVPLEPAVTRELVLTGPTNQTWSPLTSALVHAAGSISPIWSGTSPSTAAG